MRKSSWSPETKAFIWISIPIVIAAVLIYLWYRMPFMAANRAIEKAAVMGLKLSINDPSHDGPGGLIFRDVEITSTELPIDLKFQRIQIILADGLFNFKPKAIILSKGDVKIKGSIEKFAENFAAWREKHHSNGNVPSQDRPLIQAVTTNVKWEYPCGIDEATAENVAIDESLNVSASSVFMNCFGWKMKAEKVNTDLHKLKAEKMNLTQWIPLRSAQGLGEISPESKSNHTSSILKEYSVNAEIGDFDLNIEGEPGYTSHSKNVKISAKVSDAAWGGHPLNLNIAASSDEIEADLPKIHQVNVGNTEFKLEFRDFNDIIVYNISAKVEKASAKYRAITGGKAGFGPVEFASTGSVKKSGKLWHLDLDPGSHIKVNYTNILLFGFVEPQMFDVNIQIPATSCQHLIDSVPDGMNNEIEGLEMDGTASMNLGVSIRTDNDEPIVKFSYINQCKVSKPPKKVNVFALRHRFNRLVPDKFGDFSEIETGPDTPTWVKIKDISPFLTFAIQVTEDPNFFGHHGFERAAIEESIKSDIEGWKFTRGASTISMQLVKNVWLTREKTIARKIQEAFLTTYLEEFVPKEEILETYFNVIELGPSVYGIKAAADYYFKTTPADLTLGQSLFLMSILPSPRTNYFDNEGKLQTGKQEMLRLLMRALLARHFITQVQYDAGFAETVTRVTSHATN
jgi:Transglycosylase